MASKSLYYFLKNMHLSNFRKTISLSALVVLSAANPAFASNVAGVLGPGVTAGEKSLQYRSGYDPDSHGFVQRLHYQQALNNDGRLRGIVQSRKTDESDTDFDFFQGELQWQLEGSAKRAHAIRIDMRIRDRGRVGNIGVNWTNQYKLSPTLSARAVVLAGVEVGSGAKSGVLLQTRANLMHKLNNRFSVSAEIFSDYGSTSDFSSFDDQIHQIGPALSGKLTGDWSFFSGVLVGATDASPDTSLRLWISKSFK